MKIGIPFADFTIRGQRSMMIRFLSRCVEGSGTFAPYEKENGTWVLDGANDWFLTFEGVNVIDIRYRYQSTENGAEDRLYHWIQFRLRGSWSEEGAVQITPEE